MKTAANARLTKISPIVISAILSAKALLPMTANAVEDSSARAVELVVYVANNSTGRAIRQADVRVSRPRRYDMESHWDPGWRATTDSDGYARLKDLPDGAFNLYVCAVDYLGARREIHVAKGSADTIRVGLRQYEGVDWASVGACERRFWAEGMDVPTGEVVVVATEKKTGQPMRWASLIVLERHHATITGESGFATIRLEAGKRKLKLAPVGYRPVETTVRVKAGKKVKVRIRWDSEKP